MVSNGVRLLESMWNHGLGRIALQHHASHACAYHLHSALGHAKAIMAIRRGVLMLDAVGAAVFDPRIRRVDELIISPNIRDFQGACLFSRNAFSSIQHGSTWSFEVSKSR